MSKKFIKLTVINDDKSHYRLIPIDSILQIRSCDEKYSYIDYRMLSTYAAVKVVGDIDHFMKLINE